MKTDFDDRLRDEEAWWLAREIETGAGQKALDDLVTRMAAENEYADAVLDGLLESEERFAAANVAEDERFRTGGVVRRLCEAAYVELEREPLFAMTLARTAAVIADRLPDDYYPARGINELRGTAWKHISTACKYLGRFQGGHEALDRAEEAFCRLPVSIVQLAAVKLGRAGLHFEQQNYRPALEFSRSAQADFAACGDDAGELDAMQMEASVLFRVGSIEEARRMYQFVLALADKTGDMEAKGRTAQNLAVMDRNGGNLESAAAYFLIALRIFESLDYDVEALRTRWAIARLDLASGNAAQALQQLPVFIAELTRRGMAVEAAEAQLDRAEALLLLGRSDEAAEACTTLVTFFHEHGMFTGALTAAAVLSEALANKKLTREKVFQAREVLRELQLSKD